MKWGLKKSDDIVFRMVEEELQLDLVRIVYLKRSTNIEAEAMVQFDHILERAKAVYARHSTVLAFKDNGRLYDMTNKEAILPMRAPLYDFVHSIFW